MARSIFDIGMYDGGDTAYYLEMGFQVVAVEANPAMIKAAEERFKHEIATGRLQLVHAALSDVEDDLLFHLAGAHLGSSTLFPDKITRKDPSDILTVKGVTLVRLFEKFGVPYYLKCDIEGADRYAILALSTEQAPTFVSFEIGEDFELLIAHLASIGYSGFRIVNQSTFLELAEMISLSQRAYTRLLRRFGRYDDIYTWRGGHQFVRGHSSGPIPDSSSKWYDLETTTKRWRDFCQSHPEGRRYGWCDLHASLTATEQRKV